MKYVVAFSMNKLVGSCCQQGQWCDW